MNIAYLQNYGVNCKNTILNGRTVASVWHFFLKRGRNTLSPSSMMDIHHNLEQQRIWHSALNDRSQQFTFGIMPPSIFPSSIIFFTPFISTFFTKLLGSSRFSRIPATSVNKISFSAPNAPANSPATVSKVDCKCKSIYLSFNVLLQYTWERIWSRNGTGPVP